MGHLVQSYKTNVLHLGVMHNCKIVGVSIRGCLEVERNKVHYTFCVLA